MELDVFADTSFCASGRCLLILQHLFVATLDDPQPNDVLLQSHSLLFLLFLLLMQVADVIDGFLKHSCLAQLVSGSIILLLASWHEFLERVIALLDGISTLLFGLGVSFPASFLVAQGTVTPVRVTVFVIIFKWEKRFAL